MVDPIFDGMQEAPTAPRQQLVPADADWWWWRRRHPRIFISRAGEDGSQDQWEKLLAEAGAHRLTEAYRSICRKISQEARVPIARVLEELEGPSVATRTADPRMVHRAWHDCAWGRIVDLCINPATFMKFRYDTTDPERIAKATKLADDIKGWFPQARNKIELANMVLASPDRVAELVTRRLIAAPPGGP